MGATAMVCLDHDLRITLQPRSWHPRLRGLPEDRGGQAIGRFVVGSGAETRARRTRNTFP